MRIMGRPRAAVKTSRVIVPASFCRVGRGGRSRRNAPAPLPRRRFPAGNGRPGGSRTRDPRIRNPVLCPAELLAWALDRPKGLPRRRRPGFPRQNPAAVETHHTMASCRRARTSAPALFARERGRAAPPQRMPHRGNAAERGNPVPHPSALRDGPRSSTGPAFSRFFAGEAGSRAVGETRRVKPPLAKPPSVAVQKQKPESQEAACLCQARQTGPWRLPRQPSPTRAAAPGRRPPGPDALRRRSRRAAADLRPAGRPPCAGAAPHRGRHPSPPRAGRRPAAAGRAVTTPARCSRRRADAPGEQPEPGAARPPRSRRRRSSRRAVPRPGRRRRARRSAARA